MAMSLIQACRSLALSTWLLSFCFVHLLCLDFTVAEKEEWYTAFVNITYVDPVTSEIKTEKTECGRYGEHSPKKEARGQVLMPLLLQERQACDPNVKYPLPYQNSAWMALIAAGNCTFRDKIRNVAALHNASAVIIYNVGSTNVNDTITMPHQGKLHFRGSNASYLSSLHDCMRCTVSLVWDTVLVTVVTWWQFTSALPSYHVVMAMAHIVLGCWRLSVSYKLKTVKLTIIYWTNQQRSTLSICCQLCLQVQIITKCKLNAVLNP